MEYFAIINGRQVGPLMKEQLLLAGLQPDTYVWRQGLADWVKAATLPELTDILMGDSAFGGYARPEEPPVYFNGQPPYGHSPYGQQPYDQPHYDQQPYDVYGREPGPIPHTNWLTWAIIGTVVGALFSCIGMIFGIFGIVNAQKANKYYAEGFRDQGDRSNSSARTMTIVALVLGVVGLLLTVTGATSALMQNLINLPGLSN